MVDRSFTIAISGSNDQFNLTHAPVPTHSGPLIVKKYQNPLILNSHNHVIPCTYKPNTRNGICDATLEYINHVLMKDDDFEDEAATITSSTLDATERSFHEIIVGNNKTRNEEGDDEARTRNAKCLANYADETIIHEMLGKILQLNGKNKKPAPNGPYGALPRMEFSKRDAVDMRILLSKCMKFVANGDHEIASKLLKEIRSRASISGDGPHRLAHYFADGLEARLFGGRVPQHKTMPVTTITDSVLLRAVEVYNTNFPFTETAYFFANKMIMEVAGKATTLHIINFGLMHGLQWPMLIQGLTERPGGPPKLRMTGIDFPQTGFRPDARLKETGRRLSDHCRELNVPFEYNYLSKNWETVKLEDLKLEKGDVVAINCMYNLRHLLDDTVAEKSPRDIVLDLMRRINPTIFVHVVTNGAYSTPFFVPRLREALFYFSTRFDMFDTILPQWSPERMVFEREIWGKEVLNVIACEGVDRKERPETYREWHKRTTRAGFEPIPLNPTIVNEIRARVKLGYHKDFFVDEAGPWLLDGWKGKAAYALSCWKPAKSSPSNMIKN